jgi:hypothetical protein
MHVVRNLVLMYYLQLWLDRLFVAALIGTGRTVVVAVSGGTVRNEAANSSRSTLWAVFILEHAGKLALICFNRGPVILNCNFRTWFLRYYCSQLRMNESNVRIRLFEAAPNIVSFTTRS